MSRKYMNIACYSYKGGSGRSTAAVNIAFAMARQGRSGACIDMDYGAAGIHYILREMNLKSINDCLDENNGQLGIQTFMNENTYTCNLGIFSSSLMNLTDLKVRLGESAEGISPGELKIIISSDKYRTFDDLDGSAQGQWNFLEKYNILQEQLEKKFKNRDNNAFIIVDSPNGLNELSLSLLKSADIILMFYRYSIQHVQGTIEAAKKLHYFLEPQFIKKKMKIMLVGSCVPVTLVERLVRARKFEQEGIPKFIRNRYEEFSKKLDELCVTYQNIERLETYIPEDELLKIVEKPIVETNTKWYTGNDDHYSINSAETLKSFDEIAKILINEGDRIVSKRR